MAKIVGAKCRVCRRQGEKLFLKGLRCTTKKCPIERSIGAPGMHVKRRQRMTDYGQHLREIQRAKHLYGLLMRQFNRFFQEANRLAGDTGDNLLLMLERRIDTVMTRLGFAFSRAHARQMIVHGHVRLNGRRVRSPSLLVSAGDTIEPMARPRSQKYLKDTYALAKEMTSPPSYLRVESEEPLKAVMTQQPKREDVSVPFEPLAVVEYMSQ